MISAAWNRPEARRTPSGLSIIEALDTLYVMELDRKLELCVRWLKMHGNVQMFEAVIRMVAGLLAGYYATGERRRAR